MYRGGEVCHRVPSLHQGECLNIAQCISYFILPRFPDPQQLARAVLPAPNSDLHHPVQPPEVLGAEGETKPSFTTADVAHTVISFPIKDWSARRKLLQRSGGSQHDINQH